MKDTITCKKAVDYILRREEAKLLGKRRFSLWRHLQGCELCRCFLSQNKLLNDFVKIHYTLQAPQLSRVDKEQLINKALSET